MKLTLANFGAHLRGELAAAYLITGDDTLRVNEALDALRRQARERGFAEREVHFIERVAQWDDVRQSAASMSLFAEKRIIELRLPIGKPGTAGSAALVDLLKAATPDQLLIMITDHLDRPTQSSAWVKAFETRGAWLPVYDLRRNELPDWIEQRCRRAGLTPSADAVALLIERVEGNMLAAAQEIAKLALLTPGGKLDAPQVLAAVSDNSRFDVFKLSEAALEGDAARALRILAGLRAEGVEPTLVLWALVRDLRKLWQARSGDAPPGRGWSPQAAALEKAMRRVGKFPFERIVARATRADRMSKGRLQGDAWDELLLLTGEFCGVRSLPVVATSRR